MSNSTYGRIWKCDTVGMLKAGPVVVKKVVFVPNNTGDQVLLTYFDRGSEITLGCNTTFGTSYTGAVSSTDTLTISSGSILPSNVIDGSVFEITRTEGVNANIPALVKTAGTNTVVVVWDDPWTDETSSYNYEWKTYTSYDFLKAFGNTKDTIPFDFGNGFTLPNLSVETISGGAYVYIYT